MRPIAPFALAKRVEIILHHKNVFAGDGEDNKRIDGILSKWGWYRVMCDLCESNVFGSTLAQVGEITLRDALEHLAYLKDQSIIERMRQDKARGRVQR